LIETSVKKFCPPSSFAPSQVFEFNTTDLEKQFFISEQVTDLGPGILVGIILYAPVSEDVARYCMAFAVILTR